MAKIRVSIVALHGVVGAIFGVVVATWVFVLSHEGGSIGRELLRWVVCGAFLGAILGGLFGGTPIRGLAGSIVSRSAYGALVGLVTFYLVAICITGRSGGTVFGKGAIAASMFLGILVGAILGILRGFQDYLLKMRSSKKLPVPDPHD